MESAVAPCSDTELFCVSVILFFAFLWIVFAP